MESSLKREKVYRGLLRALAVGWSAMTAGILLLLFVFGESLDWISKPVNLLSRPILAAIGLVGMALILWAGQRQASGIRRLADRLPKYTIAILSVLLFAVQAYVFYQSYFLAGWDSIVVVETAREWVYGALEDRTWYYAMYPNNLMLTWVYHVVFALNDWLGNAANDAYVLILVQSLLSCLAGGLLFSVIRRAAGAALAYAGWLIYAVHVAMSPWIFILYSDGFTLIFPILILWLYQHARDAKRPWLWWLGIGAATYWGFKIKPQVLILLIAIGIVELLDAVRQKGWRPWLALGKRLAAAAAAMAVSLGLFVGLIAPSFIYKLDPDRAFGWSHFLMMGLNVESDGGYSWDDVVFSESFADTESRKQANIEKAVERIEEMGAVGLANLLTQKTMINYGDGTYAWGAEGGFFHEMYEDKNTTPALIFKSLYYGNHADLFATFQQGIWLVLLMGAVGVVLAFFGKNKPDPLLAVAVLALIGLTMFQTIFEARARYLFIYAPFYVWVGLAGWNAIRGATVGRWLKKKGEKA